MRGGQTEAMESTAERIEEDPDAYTVALDHWLASGAADLDDRVAPVLADLGLDLGRPMR